MVLKDCSRCMVYYTAGKTAVGSQGHTYRGQRFAVLR